MNSVLKNYNFYCNILSMARQDKIRLLVTPTPFYESKHIYGVVQFVMDFCYLPKVNQETANEEALKIRELAQAYCSPYTNKKGEKCKAPINPKYNAYAKYSLMDNNSSHRGFWVPTNDAYVMAEATYYGACLITENAKDLLFRPNKKQKQPYSSYENERVKGIVEINQKYGYYQPNTTTFFGNKGNLVPRPFSVENIGKIITYREDSAVFPTSDDENFAYACYEIDFYQ
jgi:hypothetical protein